MKKKTVTKAEETARRRALYLSKLNEEELKTVKLVEFMGYKLAVCSNGLAWESPSKLAKDNHFKIHGMLLQSSLYKLKEPSFELLLPVFKKCHDIDRAKLKSLISYTDLITGNLKQCYDGLLSFIEWYNANKQ